jgi:hypothetical protein
MALTVPECHRHENRSDDLAVIGLDDSGPGFTTPGLKGVAKHPASSRQGAAQHLGKIRVGGKDHQHQQQREPDPLQNPLHSKGYRLSSDAFNDEERMCPPSRMGIGKRFIVIKIRLILPKKRIR